MRILVCFKISPVLENITQDEWQSVVENNLDLSFVKWEYGCFDEAALEQALRLKDACIAAGNPCEVHAVTIDANERQNALTSLFAVGYDRIFRLAPPADFLSPEDTAQLLADFIRSQNGYDVILLGQQAVGMDNGQTHWMLSELLGIPAVTQVSSIQPTAENQLSIVHGSARLSVQACVQTPIVLGVENCEYAYLRIPTLREKLAAKHKVAECLSTASISSAPLFPQRIWHEKSCRLGVSITGDTPTEKVAKLYELVLQEAISQ